MIQRQNIDQQLSKKNRAVFLDRDGVINRAIVRDGRPYAPRSKSEVDFLPDAGMAIAALKGAGFKIIVVTNQPDVATGKTSKSFVEDLHSDMVARFDIDAIKVCYHVESDGCPCRKPLPGMLLAAAAEYRIDLAQSFMVGDRWRDIGAGNAAGCRSLFIDYQYSEALTDRPERSVQSLMEACDYILSQA